MKFIWSLANYAYLKDVLSIILMHAINNFEITVFKYTLKYNSLTFLVTEKMQFGIKYWVTNEI